MTGLKWLIKVCVHEKMRKVYAYLLTRGVEALSQEDIDEIKFLSTSPSLISEDSFDNLLGLEEITSELKCFKSDDI